MREQIIATATTNAKIQRARVTGKFSLTDVAKLNLLTYYINFTKYQISKGDDTYIDKHRELVDRLNSLIHNCSDSVCNIVKSSDGTFEYKDVTYKEDTDTGSEGSGESGSDTVDGGDTLSPDDGNDITNPYTPTPTEPENPNDPDNPDNPEEPNSPADIDDISITVENKTTTILTLDMFLSKYSDPEGDLIDAIRIESIQSTNQGKFYLEGVEITEDQIITREQLAANKFTHIAPTVDAISSDSFVFSVRDEGNGQWIQ